MRTRFLSIDYFSSSSSSPSHSSTSFFNLPVPHHPPPSGISAESFLGFNSLPIIDVPLGIDRLRIETALAKLLADVIPDTIDVGRRSSEPALSSNEKDFENGTVEEATELIHEDEEEMENCRNFEPAVLDDQLSKRDSKESVVDKSTESIELVQFEIPQLDMQLDNPLIHEKEYRDIFSQFFQIVNDMGTLNQVELHHNHETEESIYSLENIGLENLTGLENLMEQKADLVEDDCSVHGQQNFHFPLLEVDDISLGTLASMSMEDELTVLLRKTEDQLLMQNEYFMIRHEHISKFVEDTLLESASCDCLLNKCSEADLDSAEIFLEIDFISVGETFFTQVNSSFYEGKQDGNFFLSFNPFVLEELQILDACPAPLFEVFGSSKFHKPGWEEMLKEKMGWKSFDELVVSHELALADDMFRSLPVPVLSSCKAVKKIYEISEKAFSSLKPQPLSTSDDVYLDWHLLEEEKHSSAMCSSFWNLIVAIDIQRIDFDWRTDSIAEVVLDFVLSEYDSGNLSFEECGKSPEVLFFGGDVLNGHVEDASSDHCIHTNQILLSEDSLKRNSSIFNSMSPFNDLDFFLNPSKAGTEKKNEHPTTNSNGTTDKVQYINSLAACESSDWQLQRKDFILHQVHLSEDLIAITENLKRSYLGVLESNVELKSLHRSFQEVDEFSLLSVPKLVLMDCIKNLGIQKPALPGGVQMIITSATLCAVKQITWYLCFYGIQTAWSYLDKLCEGLDCLASRLRVLKRFFVDKDGKPDVAKVSSHPSLSVIQDILVSSTTKDCLKALVIADKVFWSSLKMLLTSMGISFCEMNESTQYPGSDLYGRGFFSVEKMKLLLAKDCLLASPKNIAADFPFDKFEMILEYGGHCDSSKIATLFPKLSGLPCHHFLRVEVNKSNVARALCEGVSMPEDTVMRMAEETQNVKYNKEYIDLSKLELLLNSVPLDDKVGSSEKEESCALPPIPSEPFSAEDKDIQSGMMSFPELLIIMNTQSSEKEMIVSRRSTYQKILALEKDGAQVIERDSNLPADIIISPAVCLVWYECSNMLKKSNGSHDASSWLPCHVENIATNILNFLSFSFSCCILIFEGENCFLTTIMESSDGLYAAAASLGIDLQLFCSYSAELTDEIILSCIEIGNRFIKGLFPKLPESETLAESFLCKFPSINPLIAHAIISNGGVLADFLEWSHQSRINAIQKYHVSDESISLFSALCQYGEREDSQSIMTDSSSSVSSGPDSKNCHGSLGSENKRCKYMRNPHNMPVERNPHYMPGDNLLQFEPAKQSTDSILKCPELSKYSWESTKVKESDPKGCKSSLKDFLVEKEGLDSMMTRYPPPVTDPHDCNLSRDALLPNSSGKHSLRSNIASVGNKWGINEATMSSMECVSSRNSDAVREEVRGEVVDLIGPAVFSPLNISFWVQDIDNDPIRESECSFGQCNHPTFPTVAEIESSSYCTSPLKHQKYSSNRGADELLSQEQNNERLHLNYQRTLLNADFDRRSSRKLPSTTVPGERPDRRGTPFGNALHSSHLQRGSPWTEEFLNQIRKKSMLRQRVLPPETSPCPNIRMNTPTRAKRRSPSILEFFKYQGSSTRKIPEQKRLKTSSQSLCSFKNEKAISVGLSGTPADKRARRMLSYATNEASSQTKLVWSERNIDNRV